jgi:hypothetical protein
VKALAAPAGAAGTLLVWAKDAADLHRCRWENGRLTYPQPWEREGKDRKIVALDSVGSTVWWAQRVGNDVDLFTWPAGVGAGPTSGGTGVVALPDVVDAPAAGDTSDPRVSWELTHEGAAVIDRGQRVVVGRRLGFGERELQLLDVETQRVDLRDHHVESGADLGCQISVGNAENLRHAQGRIDQLLGRGGFCAPGARSEDREKLHRLDSISTLKFSQAC